MKNMTAINASALLGEINKTSYSMPQIAKILGVDVSTLRLAFTRGTMKPDMLERLVAIVGGKLDDYIAKLPTPRVMADVSECMPGEDTRTQTMIRQLVGECSVAKHHIMDVARMVGAIRENENATVDAVKDIVDAVDRIATYTSQTNAKIQRLCEELLTSKEKAE